MSSVKKVAAAGLSLAAAAVAGKVLMDKLAGKPVNESGSASTGAPEVKPLDEAELGGEVSQELLDILVCPLDKGPLELIDGGKWLLNPRNGYRYPIRGGIPIMLIEEGEKYQDPSLIRATS